MGSKLFVNGFKFNFYDNDHGIPHVHVVKNNCETKIEIETLKVVKSKGYKKQEIRKILNLIKKNETFLMNEWRKKHG